MAASTSQHPAPAAGWTAERQGLHGALAASHKPGMQSWTFWTSRSGPGFQRGRSCWAPQPAEPPGRPSWPTAPAMCSRPWLCRCPCPSWLGHLQRPATSCICCSSAHAFRFALSSSSTDGVPEALHQQISSIAALPRLFKPCCSLCVGPGIWHTASSHFEETWTQSRLNLGDRAGQGTGITERSRLALNPTP